MRFQLMSVGDYVFFDEPTNKKGLIGGKVIAANLATGEETFRIYKRLHTGQTNKFDILGKLMLELIPPSPEEKTESSEDKI